MLAATTTSAALILALGDDPADRWYVFGIAQVIDIDRLDVFAPAVAVFRWWNDLGEVDLLGDGTGTAAVALWGTPLARPGGFGLGWFVSGAGSSPSSEGASSVAAFTPRALRSS